MVSLMNKCRRSPDSLEESVDPRPSGGESTATNSSLNLDFFRRFLATQSLGRRVHLFQEIDSTNDFLKNISGEDSVHGMLAVAEFQTSGRGRQGRQWVAPSGKNLLFSLLLRAETDISPGLVTLAGACAVVEAVREEGVDIGIKWPNDLVAADLKLGGILCETVWSPKPPKDYILGIGLNVNLDPADLPEDLRNSAATLKGLAQRPLDRNRLLGGILICLEPLWRDLNLGVTHRILKNARSWCTTLGREVRVQMGETVLEGQAVEIGDHGELVLRLSHGAMRVISSGEITHIRPL
jgi:BirA family biotin operon repressor/biotin-[acetyl-CoA-carboxylase] ligase